VTTAVERLSRRLPAKRAFITGAASGLGLEIARRLAAGGWNVGMLDVNAAQLAAAGQFYAVLPRRYLKLWRFKRFFPVRFMRAFPLLREQLVASMQRRRADASGR